MSAAVERRHWHFTGSVQGVGFRYRAQYAAQLLDLTGWVENNWDGTVDLEAQGPTAQQSRLFMHNIRFSFVLSRQAVRLPCSQSLG